MMEPAYIHPPLPREALEAELTPERFVRDTGKGKHKVYILNHANAPTVVKEIGRLRELAFAMAGGGTGLALDLDDFDLAEDGYQQLIVYAPDDQEIIGGYRFKDCKDIDPKTWEASLSTAHYFRFSDQFLREYLPYTIELGRSFVQPNYQPHINPRKGIFALDNLWDGLGAIVNTHPNMKYFFGKVTMYPSFNREARNAVLHFMHHFFPDNENLVTPIYPEPIEEVSGFLDSIQGLEFRAGLKVLAAFCKERGELVPPLIKNYMQLSPTMKTFGTFTNRDFGEVEETGILVNVHDIYQEKKDRYLS